MGRIQLRNEKNTGKSFLQYFEFQDVANNVQPKTILDQNAKLVLILAGSELTESTFSFQLLNHAVESALSVAQISFVRPHCRQDKRFLLSCTNAAAMNDFDESLYAHVSTEEVDRFIRDHAIDGTILPLAELFAKTAILGSTGSMIAAGLRFDVIDEFVFKDDMKSVNYIANLERRAVPWQPSPIPPEFQKLILIDLVRKRQYIFLLVTLLIIIDLIIC